ncbi:MAG: undecaprenyl/decaprenyl-phosphate alpha-N-acetylglucosaminyl 1-phosphate transferase [Odoribacter sp.]|nr:undecaprenyl/decaprenyl-phosphate alpha-N-acetylglucosaminyl 1-phosphate transferase [Odoribacter sp.]
MMLNLFSDDLRLVLSMLLALLIGWNIRIPVFKMAIQRNFVDRPNKRSSHTGCVPNIGGIVVFLAFLCSFMLFVRFERMPELQYVVLGAILNFIVGIYDDMLQISPRKKMKGEICGILVLVVGGGFYLDTFHGFLGMYEITPWIGVPLTFIGLLGLVNAINLIDGIDGLCSGVVLVDSLFFGMWFYKCGQIEYALLCGVLAASILPFFFINLFSKRTKMFMGDSGALMVGYLLGVLAIKFCETDVYERGISMVNAAPGVVFCVLAIPVLDTLRLFIARKMRGVSPFAPDKNHLHHKLLIIFDGVHRKATFTILTLNLFFIVFGVVGRDWPNAVLIVSAIVLFSVIFYIVNRLAKQKMQKSAL